VNREGASLTCRSGTARVSLCSSWRSGHFGSRQRPTSCPRFNSHGPGTPRALTTSKSCANLNVIDNDQRPHALRLSCGEADLSRQTSNGGRRRLASRAWLSPRHGLPRTSETRPAPRRGSRAVRGEQPHLPTTLDVLIALLSDARSKAMRADRSLGGGAPAGPVTTVSETTPERSERRGAPTFVGGGVTARKTRSGPLRRPVHFQTGLRPSVTDHVRAGREVVHRGRLSRASAPAGSFLQCAPDRADPRRSLQRQRAATPVSRSADVSGIPNTEATDHAAQSTTAPERSLRRKRARSRLAGKTVLGLAACPRPEHPARRRGVGQRRTGRGTTTSSAPTRSSSRSSVRQGR